MEFDQYHEPASELFHETRTFARMIMSMIEEADAIKRKMLQDILFTKGDIVEEAEKGEIDIGL